MNIDDRQLTDRSRGPFTHFAKLWMCQPIPFMFDSKVGFSATADRTAPFPVGSNPRWRPAAILKNQTAIAIKHILRFFMHEHRLYFALRLYNDCWQIWLEIGH